MTITEKKVITIIHAEIGYEEFADALNNLLSDFKNNRYTESNQLALTALRTLVNKELTVADICEIFTAWFNNAAHDATLRYLARQYGYSMHNYGIYDEHLKCITCSFEQNGTHI